MKNEKSINNDTFAHKDIIHTYIRKKKSCKPCGKKITGSPKKTYPGFILKFIVNLIFHGPVIQLSTLVFNFYQSLPNQSFFISHLFNY